MAAQFPLHSRQLFPYTPTPPLPPSLARPREEVHEAKQVLHAQVGPPVRELDNRVGLDEIRPRRRHRVQVVPVVAELDSPLASGSDPVADPLEGAPGQGVERVGDAEKSGRLITLGCSPALLVGGPRCARACPASRLR